MSDKRFNIDPSTPGAITIYEGNALTLKHPEKVIISGDFNAVKNFIEKRQQDSSELQSIDYSKTVITTNIEKGTIKLQTNPNDCFGTEVTAIIEMHPNLKAFGINTGKAYSQDDFVKLLKINRRFLDPAKYLSLLQSYASFQIKGTTDNIQSVINQTGGQTSAFDKKVDTGNLPLEFDLNIPIFKGSEKSIFTVLVYVESKERIVSFSLESIDLIEMIESKKEELFNQQIENDFRELLVINE